MPVAPRKPAKARAAAAPGVAAHTDEAPSAGRPPNDRLLRFDQMQAKVGLGRTAIYGAMKEGVFPMPVQLLGRAVAWRESELDAWIAALPHVQELAACA